MAVILPGKARDAKKKVRTAKGVKPPRSVKKNYFSTLKRLNDSLDSQTKSISDMINGGASPADVGIVLQRAINQSDQLYTQQASPISDAFVTAASLQNKERLQNVIKNAFGVDFATIVDSPELANSLELAKIENVSLIKSIPNQHWNKVIKAVSDNFVGLPMEGGVTLSQRLKEIGHISDSKANLIARDQTGKLNSSLTAARHQEVGIKKYIWRTSKDERVVGTPGGLYPQGNRVHGNHFDREGQTYYYERPPADGNPGFPIQCRCFAEPVIDLDDLNVVYT